MKSLLKALLYAIFGKKHYHHYSSSDYKRHHFKKYSSSDYKKHHYGHSHYKKKFTSIGFFSS
jgi:hypothetical protein